MYVGHVGVALGAKRFAPSFSLALLVFAAYLPDWADAALCTTGLYHDAQILSHSIPAALVLALLAAASQVGRADRTAIVVVTATILSHVVLDYITGIKPTWPGGPFVGLQLYRNPVADFVVESVVIVAGWLVYTPTLPRFRSSFNPATGMLFALLAMQAAVDTQRLLSPSINKC